MGTVYEKTYSSENIYQYIISSIRSGDLEPGAKITAEIIAEKFSVSRTPVREVLTRLSSENILTKIPQKGFFVKSWSLDEINQNYTVIAYLDTLCAKLAMEKLLPADIKKLKEIVARIDVAIDFCNLDDYIENQLLFHDTYFSKCGNTVLIDTIHHVLSKPIPITYTRSQLEEKSFDILKDGNFQHKKIIECFETKNFEEIQKTITVHWHC